MLHRDQRLRSLRALANLLTSVICADKDVNDCDPEDAEKCWEITPANLANMETVLNVGQNVLALGK